LLNLAVAAAQVAGRDWSGQDRGALACSTSKQVAVVEISIVYTFQIIKNSSYRNFYTCHLLLDYL
jgi:hypothetical protein